MAFTNETKFGHKDGQHVGFFGDFALFVRIVGGKYNYVGKGVQGGTPTMIKLGRDWMKAAFPSPADALLFDKCDDSVTNDVDSREPVASFVETIAKSTSPTLLRPDVAQAASYVATTTTTTTGGTTTVGTTTVNTGANLITPGTVVTPPATTDAAAAKKKKTTKMVLIALGAVAVAVAVYYFVVKK